MKKLVTIVIILLALIILLIALAFYYIDLSGHRSFRYDLLQGGELFGSVKVDRYITENKIVYKSSAKYPHSDGYPVVNEKLFVKKRTRMPLKFIEEAGGVKGQKRLTSLVQDEDKTDFLFLEHPRFIALKGFETGEKTMVFSPDSVMLYMPIMERYNFWKKGSQFFEIMIPSGEPLPPLRDKLEVKYLADEYIPLMARKVEAESFAFRAGSLPEAKVFLSKYTHRLLALEIKKTGQRFNLVNFSEGPSKRIKPLLDKLGTIFKLKKATGVGIPSDKEDISAPELLQKEVSSAEEAPVKGKEIFFESDKLILSGRVWVPETPGAFPGILVIPREGPMTIGEQDLLDSLGELLSASGFVVLVFDSPGQGKSQGSFVGLDEEKKIQNIIAAGAYLNDHPDIKKGSINLIGHEGGGYLALKAASELPSVRSCVLLNIPLGHTEANLTQRSPREEIQALLNARSLGPFTESFMKHMTEKVHEHQEDVIQSGENFSFVLGVKVPIKEYREFMARDSYGTIISFDRPLLVVVGKDDKYFNARLVDKLKKELIKKDRRNNVALFKSPGAYMGRMVGQDGSWTFSPNKDVFDLVREWIAENGTREEEVLPAASESESEPENALTL
ncbi:alpha/beta hydrolase family protein [Candidatus Omnitrophota bacterium]